MIYLKYLGLMIIALTGVMIVAGISLWLCSKGTLAALFAPITYLAGFYILRRLYRPFLPVN